MNPSGAPDLSIALESPRQDDIVRLVAELDAHLLSLYPADTTYLLDIESLNGPDVRFFVARLGSHAVGCGALRIHDAGYGAVKRMFIRPEARGRKIARRILERVEEQASAERLGCIRLETGVHQPEAIKLYESSGYAVRGPFGEYRPDPLSIFMEKQLAGTP